MRKRGRERSTEMKRKLNDPEIQRWWRENEEKLHSNELMPEYPVNEKLPLIEDPSTVWPNKAITQDEYDAMIEFGSIIGDLINGRCDMGLTSDELSFIRIYWGEGIPLTDVCDMFGLTEEQVHSKARLLKKIVIRFKREGLASCVMCGKVKRLIDFSADGICDDCTERGIDD